MSNAYNIALALHLLTGLLWLACLLAAFSRYRAFKQRGDLAWTGAFALLALVGWGQAFALWQMFQQGASPVLDRVLWYDLRYAALTLLAAMLALWAFTRRRALL